MRLKISIVFICALLFPCVVHAQETEKVGVLITGWGMPAGYNHGYAWASPDHAQIGDKTEYEGQPCKFGHVGDFPYQSHINMIPWAITFKTDGSEDLWDYHGIYKLENDVYVNSSGDPQYDVLPGQIPPGIPITALKDITDHTGAHTYPLDSRDGTDHLAGWYRIGSFDMPFPNGLHDFKEANPAYYTRYYGVMGVPESASDPNGQHPAVQAQDDYLEQLMEDSFGDRIDIRYGYYTPTPEYTKIEDAVAEEFGNEGFTKMVVARETTDHNHYANDFMSLNYVKERLCEIGKLNGMQIFQTRQVGRTPEFNTMNMRNLEPFIKAFDASQPIGIIYVTRGLSWGQDETTGEAFGRAHPWSKEVYHENAYLNFLSWKKALQDAFGSSYTMVFTKAGKEGSDLREDNFFTYGLSTDIDLKGYGGESLFYSIRQAIQFAKEAGLQQILVAPCHWNYDNLDNIFRMKEMNKLPVGLKADLEDEKYDVTHCEDEEGNEVECSSPDKAAKITVAPSFSSVPGEFATSYYVVLRGTLERFGLYPQDIMLRSKVSQNITKLEGGVVRAKFFSLINGAKIEIPADPHPTWPESFTPETAVPVNDPTETNDCMWDDNEIIIAHQLNPPDMKSARPVGPAVHFGPYRTFFNRDVTITIPYRRLLAFGRKDQVKAYIYNHVTEDWDSIEPEQVANGKVTFKAKVLGLFRAGIIK